jgi:DNA-binding transcriptional LysR family regulator
VDTRFLESFVQVVELGSIAATARLLDLTPTAVSLRIKALEEETRTPLIERAGRTVVPTQAGSKVLMQAKLILAEVKNFNSLATSNELPAGPLKLGTVPSTLNGTLPAILKKWADRYENIEILIEPGSSTSLYQRVIQGELDAAILVHPLFEIPKICNWQSLRTEHLILLTPSTFKKRDPFAIIRENPFIRYDRRVVAGKMADEYLKAHNVHPHARMELDGINHIANLVKDGLGVSVLPDWAEGNHAEPALMRHKLPEPTPTRTVGLLWLRSTFREKLVQAFQELVMA